MKRIEQQFQRGKAFVGYLTAGDGGIERTLAAALALIAAGVTLLEIGVPFSDPIADGPVIQNAAARSLAQGTTLQDVLWLSQEIRKRSEIPLILFSYLNPILAVSQTSFFHDAKAAGLDGILIVDCPIEASPFIHQRCLVYDLAPIYVLTPTTSFARMQHIDRYGKGCLYYACRKGTTGMRDGLPEDFVSTIQTIQAHVHLPVITGFGISSYQTAEKVLQYADGVVVGSLFVKALEDGASPAELTQLARRINPLERVVL
ncbi:MAG: tryptophan synthase subunit alpha [Gammaproteobacteria bacterium]|nr:tryptophan synthase subunit alpha [Gammaproteobacteria bacterium]